MIYDFVVSHRSPTQIFAGTDRHSSVQRSRVHHLRDDPLPDDAVCYQHHHSPEDVGPVGLFGVQIHYHDRWVQFISPFYFNLESICYLLHGRPSSTLPPRYCIVYIFNDRSIPYDNRRQGLGLAQAVRESASSILGQDRRIIWSLGVFVRLYVCKKTGRDFLLAIGRQMDNL